MLGKQALLSGRDVEKLLAARARYGIFHGSQVNAECPVTSDDSSPQRVSMTREELEALIEEAMRKSARGANEDFGGTVADGAGTPAREDEEWVKHSA